MLRIGRYNEALELAEARRQSLGRTDPNRNLVQNWVRTIEAVIDAPPGDRDRVINSDNSALRASPPQTRQRRA